MSGHGKWANIKRRKGAQDALRSRVFSRLSRELAVAVQEGGSADPMMNPRLRLAIQSARAQNMPSSRIAHAIQRALGRDSEALLQRTFEGYSADGIGILVEAATDSINRTVGHVRAAFHRHGGSLGQDGCLQFAFQQVGHFAVEASPAAADDLLLALIDAGLEDGWHEEAEGELHLICPAEAFGAVRTALVALSYAPVLAELEPAVQVFQPLPEARWGALEALVEALSDSEDVLRVSHNAQQVT